MSTLSPTASLRAVAFVDAQNLIHDAEREFQYRYPNFDIVKLVAAVCKPKGWAVSGIRFYTGVPSEAQSYRWKLFWDRKLFAMKATGVEVVRFPLKDRQTSVQLYDRVKVFVPPRVEGDEWPSVPVEPPWATAVGRALAPHTIIEQRTFVEKGVDVSIAVDAIKFALEGRYDVCLLFSRDADLQPAVEEVKRIARDRNAYLHLASAFPSASPRAFGVPGTMHLPIDRATYDGCLDPKDYFPKRSPS